MFGLPNKDEATQLRDDLNTLYVEYTNAKTKEGFND